MQAKCSTNADHVILKWNDGQNHLTVPLDPKTNIATLQLAHGYTHYKALCNTAELHIHGEDNNPLLVDATYISDDDEAQDASTFHTGRQSLSLVGDAIDWGKPITASFNLDGPNPNVIPNEEDRNKDGKTNTGKLLNPYKRFGHISFKELQVMARLGLIQSA